MGLLKCWNIYVWSYHIPFLWTWPQIHWICGDQGIVIYWNRKNMSQIEEEKVPILININITILWSKKKWLTLRTRGTRERRELSKLSKTNKWQTGRGSFFLGPGNVGLFTNIIFIFQSQEWYLASSKSATLVNCQKFSIQLNC